MADPAQVRLTTGDELMGLLADGLKQDAESREILQGLCNAVARVEQVLEMRRAQFPELESADLCRADWLPNLAWDVGLSDDVRLRDYFDTDAEWRAWCRLAAEVWRSKGEHGVYRRIVRAAAGVRIWIGDWFSFRLTAPMPSWAWFAAASVASGGAYITELHVEDPAGTIDRAKVMDALDLVRPFGERLNVTFVHVVESWLEGLGRWTVTKTAAIDEDAGELVLGPDATGASSIDFTSSEADPTAADWDQVHFNAIVSIATGTLRFRFRDSGAAYYEVAITDTGTTATNNVKVVRSAVVQANATVLIPTDTDLLLQVATYPTTTGGNLVIEVRINGTTVATYTDTSPLSRDGFQWIVDSGTSEASVVWMEAMPGGAETRTIP